MWVLVQRAALVYGGCGLATFGYASNAWYREKYSNQYPFWRHGDRMESTAFGAFGGVLTGALWPLYWTNRLTTECFKKSYGTK
jgi:hypothetical protein